MKKRWGACFCYISLVGILLVGGCACPPTDPEELRAYEEADDPLEPLNRTMFKVNIAADKLVIKPAAKGYRAVTPQIVRTGVRNFFINLRQPMYLANALMQLEGRQALAITERFLTNTLFGFFGLADTASEINIPVYDPDFGQTLYVWGVKDGGPYMVLPLLGPSNPRDAVGIGVDSFLAPIDYALANEPVLIYTRVVLDGWTKREAALDFLDSLEQSSTDYYATMRSMWRQNRQNKLNHSNVIIGSKPDENEKKDYEFDFPTDDEYDDEE